MKCPNDGSTLTMSERSGIEIDYCPECRGVWLDRGELDKLIERAAAHAAPTAAPVASAYERERDERQQDYQQRYSDPQRYARQPPPRKKHKESWLSEILG